MHEAMLARETAIATAPSSAPHDRAWKTKRLWNNPSVEVAPSTFRGRVTGPTIAARAMLLADGQADIAAKAVARQHHIMQGLLAPITHRLMGYQTMHYDGWVE